MRGATALLATAALLGACSSGGAAAPHKASQQVLTGTPSSGTTACSAVPKDAIAQVYGSPVVKTAPRSPSRATETRQSGCIVDLQGEKYTTLAVYLWYGDGFKDQWVAELNGDGTDGLSEQPYGIEAYGMVQSYQTTVDIRERNFAVRLLCGPTAAHPDKPIGIDGCARIADALDAQFSH